MPSGKALGNDSVTTEILKAGGQELWESFAQCFSKCLEVQKIPDSWKELTTVLYKKVDFKDLRNYRAICLLPNIYKLIIKSITKKLTRTLDEQQPREQA